MKIEPNVVLNWTVLQMFWKISKTKYFTNPKIVFRTKSEDLSNQREKIKTRSGSAAFKIKNCRTLVLTKLVGTKVAYKVGIFSSKTRE
jgi:hypothetical protein